MTDACLPRSTPEAQGVSSPAIGAFVDAAERDVRHLHSIMLVRHGHVVAEGWWDPYRPRSPHMLFSLSKSFTSTAIGLLVTEGRLAIDAPVLDFFRDDMPPAPDANLRAMRVRHLLSMSTGHARDTPLWSSEHWARTFLAQPVDHEPGTHFLYNSGATYMLSAIVQQITGTRMLEYLRPRLFEPLGIENPTWETSPQGIDIGYGRLSVTTAAIARFGQLYLRRGMWQGARLLPEEWIDEATACHISNGPAPDPDWGQGYGYQFWRCRHGAYRGDGAFGQFCVVLPQQDAVLAITAGTGTMQRVLDLVWKHLLPAMGPAPLADDRAAHEALTERLAGLRLPSPRGRSVSAVARGVSGRTYPVAANDDGIEAIGFRFEDGDCLITIHNDRGVQQIPCGYGRWLRGAASVETAEPAPVAASGAWKDEQTYVAQLWWCDTSVGRTLTCRFEGDRLLVEQEANVSFGPTARSDLKGQME